MATLNATPDSFSDGGLHYSISDALAYAHQAVREGADMIDIGGYSTRPGASNVDVAEEIRRVVPLIREIRREGIVLPISVDTFRAEVAEQAVLAGANSINDVTAFQGDAEMLDTAKRLGVPVVMMHSRGLADQNKEYAKGVMNTVREELGLKVRRALRNGVRRWNVVVDPGIGFSKTVEGNLELIRDLREFTRMGEEAHPLDSMPVLLGTSRKSFLGKIIPRQVEAKERDAATAATVTAGIAQGCDVIRVHDVAQMRDVAAVADALYRKNE
jgi:dihydroneopterin aldolase / 2-amino-4-hydroxy-6-hydroxymethyldihydropteridine diphosphokinase / dihydropteroate synthase